MSEPLNPTPLISVVEDVAQVGRRIRQPLHTHNIRHRPCEISPFMIAPVLSGDSLEQIDLKTTIVSDPVKNPLLGWWVEHMYYYVKLTDLDDAEAFKNLMLLSTATLNDEELGWRIGPSSSAAQSEVYLRQTNASDFTYDFVSACLDKIVEHFFRDEDEINAGAPLWNQYDGGYLPLARVKPPGQESWMESLSLDGTEGVPDVVISDPNLRDPEDPYYEMWLKMQELRVTDLTYEDWLRDQGIRGVETKRPQRPLELRHSRLFKKPSVTPDSSGNVGAVIYADVEESATKKRFFKEPGFIVGVSIARPKVYLSKQLGAAVNDLMTNAFAWMPKALSARPELALRKFADGTGPLGTLPNPTAGYWVDVVDLMLYGDQFVNFSLTETNAGLVALPGPLLTKDDSLYLQRADMEALFTSANAAGVVAGRQFKQEGVTRLKLASRLRDLT